MLAVPLGRGFVLVAVEGVGSNGIIYKQSISLPFRYCEITDLKCSVF